MTVITPVSVCEMTVITRLAVYENDTPMSWRGLTEITPVSACRMAVTTLVSISWNDSDLTFVFSPDINLLWLTGLKAPTN